MNPWSGVFTCTVESCEIAVSPSSAINVIKEWATDVFVDVLPGMDSIKILVRSEEDVSVAWTQVTENVSARFAEVDSSEFALSAFSYFKSLRQISADEIHVLISRTAIAVIVSHQWGDATLANPRTRWLVERLSGASKGSSIEVARHERSHARLCIGAVVHAAIHPREFAQWVKKLHSSTSDKQSIAQSGTAIPRTNPSWWVSLSQFSGTNSNPVSIVRFFCSFLADIQQIAPISPALVVDFRRKTRIIHKLNNTIGAIAVTKSFGDVNYSSAATVNRTRQEAKSGHALYHAAASVVSRMVTRNAGFSHQSMVQNPECFSLPVTKVSMSYVRTLDSDCGSSFSNKMASPAVDTMAINIREVGDTVFVTVNYWGRLFGMEEIDSALRRAFATNGLRCQVEKSAGAYFEA